MIITRSPLRISLGGGGTDLPSYYKKHGGFLISAAINKYIYIALHNTFEKGLYLKYSNYERVKKVIDIRHPIIRESLKNIKDESLKNIEIISLADIPARTGLGSSGSFTNALLLALYTQKKKKIDKRKLAELACFIEINKLNEPSGKQDQYISSYGGIKKMKINKKGYVDIKDLKISKKNTNILENNISLFFTGYLRRSSKILNNQKNKTQKNDRNMIENLHYIKKLGVKSSKALEKGNFNDFANYLDEHWKKKIERDKQMSNSKINKIYQIALKQGGAIGGKLIGAGGGGFLMFYSTNKSKLKNVLNKNGLKMVDFTFEFKGTQILNQDDHS